MPPSVTIHDSRRATQVTLKAVVLLASVLTIVFFISVVFSDRGLPELQHARTQVAALRAEITRLEPPDNSGCNWSTAMVLDPGGTPPEVYVIGYATIVFMARSSWNLK